MKYIETQIEAISHNKKYFQNAILEEQEQLRKYIQKHSEHNEIMDLKDLERFYLHIKENHTKIEHCNIVIRELIILKQMNEKGE